MFYIAETRPLINIPSMRIGYFLAFHSICYYFSVNHTIYENWRCMKCQATPGFTYCQWDGQFHYDGGCLPNINNGVHAPCGDFDGDVVVKDCKG